LSRFISSPISFAAWLFSPFVGWTLVLAATVSLLFYEICHPAHGHRRRRGAVSRQQMNDRLLQQAPEVGLSVTYSIGVCHF
jgi:hypothetical protein